MWIIFLMMVKNVFAGGSMTTILLADGRTDSYLQIKKAFNSLPETPDCAHKAFGHHIDQVFDQALGRNVFVFKIHVSPDDDRCTKSDRQRVEITTRGSKNTPPHLIGYKGESVEFRWRFLYL